jgi:hypothetical protein
MMRACKGLFGAGVLLALGACTDVASGPSEPLTRSAPDAPSLITFGAPDARHPYVGALIFQSGGDFYSCTGTLISPTVMVTAGHCVQSNGQTNTVTYARFDQNALAGRSDYTTLQAWLDAKWVRADSVVAHPLFDDFKAFPNTYDVGIVILSKPLMLSQYGVLPAIGLLESISRSPKADRLFTAVGYGLQGQIKPFYSDVFARFSGTTMLIEAHSTRAGDGQSAKFSNNPGIGGGTCYGDSGGPIFYGTTNIIGATTSFGFTPCIGNDFNFRLDTKTAQDFIKHYLN